MTASITTPTLEDELEQYLSVDAIDSEREGFEVKDEEQAIWAVRKLLARRSQVESRAAVARREMERIERWLDEANGPLLKDIEFFCGLLTSYHARVLTDEPKRKTIKLPGVQLKARAQQPEWTFDEDAFVAWAQINAPDLVKVTSAPVKPDAKKALTATPEGTAVDASGEVVDGIVVAPATVKFSVVVE